MENERESSDEELVYEDADEELVHEDADEELVHEDADEDLVHEEEEAAASEAGRIGGAGGADEVTNEAERPLAEGGEGEAEGFELAEHDLVENAGDMGGPDPSDQAFTPEEERSGAEYGEADHVESSETDDDAADSGE